MNDLLFLLKYRLIWVNVLLLVVAAVLTFMYSFIAPVLFILLTNLFDILGYYFVLVHKKTIWPSSDIVKAYRIIQVMFDVVLLVVIAQNFGYVQAVNSLILKFFGVQDLVYYLFLQKPYPKEWSWMGFTPLGWFVKKIKHPFIAAQGIIGIIITILLNFIL